MTRAPALTWSHQQNSGLNLLAASTKLALSPIQLLFLANPFLFLAALTAMLLRHPDVRFYAVDRVAFVVLVVAVAGRALVQRQRIHFGRASVLMLVLTLLALASVLRQPFDHESWSLLASKFIVPFTLFHLAPLVFTNESRLRQFEVFALIVLAYLTFTAIAFLVGAHSLIFPRFILDDSLGIQADRARGPLLQAVANGVSLNILGLLALHAYRRGAARNATTMLLLCAVPVAILATMTRAVWLGFATTVVALIVLSKNSTARRLCIAFAISAALVLIFATCFTPLGTALSDRLEERGPVEFREAVYAGAWQMFFQHPFLGWGFHQIPANLPHYVSGYREKLLYPHSTYLELMVEHGALGLLLYLWLIWEIVRLGQGTIPPGERHGFLNRDFHRMWPMILAVYFGNAAVVVMSYQFVNGLVFTLAGMLAAQQQRARYVSSC